MIRNNCNKNLFIKNIYKIKYDFLIKKISTKFLSIKITFNDYLINNLLNKEFKPSNFKYQINLINLDNKIKKINFYSSLNQEEINYNKENLSNFSKIFNFSYDEKNSNIIISNISNVDAEFELDLSKNLNYIFNLKNSKNIFFNTFHKTNNKESISIINNNDINKNFNNLNIEINSLNSDLFFEDNFYIQNLKLYSVDSIINFKDFNSFYSRNQNEILTKLKNIKISGIDDENTPYSTTKENLDINKNKKNIFYANLENTNIKFEKIKNFDEFTLLSKGNNFIKINYLDVKSFNFNISEKDKLNMKIFHLFENSIFKIENIDFKNIKIKIHPLLIFNLNVFNSLKGKFIKHLIFDNEGYSFCPTIVFDINKDFPKNYLIGYELIKFSRLTKIIFYSLFGLLFTKILFLSENDIDNCNDMNNFNTLNNLQSEISEFKYYQLYMKGKFFKYLEKL